MKHLVILLLTFFIFFISCDFGTDPKETTKYDTIEVRDTVYIDSSTIGTTPLSSKTQLVNTWKGENGTTIQYMVFDDDNNYTEIDTVSGSAYQFNGTFSITGDEVLIDIDTPLDTSILLFDVKFTGDTLIASQNLNDRTVATTKWVKQSN